MALAVPRNKRERTSRSFGNRVATHTLFKTWGGINPTAQSRRIDDQRRCEQGSRSAIGSEKRGAKLTNFHPYSWIEDGKETFPFSSSVTNQFRVSISLLDGFEIIFKIIPPLSLSFSFRFFRRDGEFSKKLHALNCAF